MPRAGLTPQRVVAEAALVADEGGWERLTLAAVAQRFGVALPSLYKHVRNLDALRREIALLAVRELTAATASVEGRAGADALRGFARAYRGWALAHPGRYAASLRAPAPDDADHLAATEAALALVWPILAGYGIERGGDDAVDAARALRSAVHGFVSLELAGGFGLPEDVERSFERLLDGLDAALAQWGRSKAGSPPARRSRAAR